MNTYRVTIRTGATEGVFETDATDSFRAINRVIDAVMGEIPEDLTTKIYCCLWAEDIFPLPAVSPRVTAIQGALSL